jgi:hypothetical protein
VDSRKSWKKFDFLLKNAKILILTAFFPLYDKGSKIVQNLDFFFFEMIIFLYKKTKGVK